MDKTPEELYQERDKRVTDAIHLRIPDRVPLEIAFSYFPARDTGITCEAAWYDYDKWLAACKKTLLDFQPDIGGVQPLFPGKVLEYLLQLPKAKVFGHFDTTDIFKAKEVLRGYMCIVGDIPCSLLQTGTTEDGKRYCQKLIDAVGKDGGFIMSTRSPVDDVKTENLKMMIDFTKEYRVYR